MALILFSPELARVKPPELSGIYGEQVKEWEKSGKIVIMLLNLSSTETSNLVDMVSSHFGKYILKTFVGRKGKIWTVKGFKVGFMILPVGLNDGSLQKRPGEYERGQKTLEDDFPKRWLSSTSESWSSR